MNKTIKLDFNGQTLDCGIDAHKKNWRVNIRDHEFEMEDYSQNPCPENLMQHLHQRYPGAKFRVCYEAGFCGFGIQRALSKYKDVECIVVNAADVPTTDKEKRRKTDKIDARKLSMQLNKGELKGIYVPEPLMEHARSLVRQRTRLVWDQTRCKNRIWHLLMFSGLELPSDKDEKHWSRRFIEGLRNLPMADDHLKHALELALDECVQIRQLLKKALHIVVTAI